MSSATDKARFFLEKSVPELKEYESKKIFTKEEITAIIKKRSDFEHKINARGAKPADFVRYVEYEINLEALRRMRVKRMGIRAPGHSGTRRIFFVLERATRRFQGDLNLWIQYIEFARKQKSYKKLSIIFTDALRLHPTSAELWIYAAKSVLDDQADMSQARSYMQRGLRFCKNQPVLWLQYAKLELIYITKLVARQHILGLTETRTKDTDETFDTDADMIAVPKLTDQDINPDGNAEAAENAIETLNSTPALGGAIPIAIFDAAMKNFQNDDRFAADFYDMVLEFENLPCQVTILRHVVDSAQTHQPTSFRTQICYIKFPTAGVRVTSPEFPRAIGGSFARIKECQPLSGNLAKELVRWLKPLAETKDLDPSLKKAIVSTARNAERTLSE